MFIVTFLFYLFSPTKERKETVSSRRVRFCAKVNIIQMEKTEKIEGMAKRSLAYCQQLDCSAEGKC